MQRLFLLAAFLLLPLAARAQSSLSGRWHISLTVPDGRQMNQEIRATAEADTLRLVLLGEAEVDLEEVSVEGEKLAFTIPSGHGRVACTLYRKDEDTYTGLCAGPIGESATTLKRLEQKEQ